MNIDLIRPLKHSLAGVSVVLAASMAVAQVAAGATPVTRVYVVEVPPAQDHAFNVGVKAWQKCLHAHGDTQTTYAYDAETGDLSRYVFLESYSSWAAMDEHGPAGKACRALFLTGVQPHVGAAVSAVSELNAKDSYLPGGDPDPAPMLWVDAYRIKPGQGATFHETLAEFAAAAAKIHWQGHFGGYDVEGSGQGAEDFVMVWPNKNWADVGTDPNPSAKDMMEGAYGKAAADANFEKFSSTVAEHWSDGWSYDKDLSFIPGK